MGKLQEVYSEKKMDEWLDNREVCMILGISLRTLQSLRSNGTLSFTQIDRKVYYHKQDVISLLETIKNKNKVWEKSLCAQTWRLSYSLKK